MNPNDIVAYDDKSLADILREAHNNSRTKSERIGALIDQLSELIKNKDSALILVPLIKDYLAIDITNDGQVIKIAQIIQRVATGMADAGETGSTQLPDSMKSELRTIAKELRSQVTDKKVDKLKEDHPEIADDIDSIDPDDLFVNEEVDIDPEEDGI